MRFISFSFQQVLVCALFLTLMGCSSKATKDFVRPSQDGHPPSHMIPKHLERIPDAEPKVEPLSRYGNRFKKNSTNTYVALKKKYAVMPTSKGYKAQGHASWYGTKFQGRKTSSGEPYDMFAMTAAHKTLPLPTYARVTNVDTGKSIIVKVNDRGPFHNDRLIDLSYVAAHKLGIVGRGTGRVQVESIDPRDHHGKVKGSKTKPFFRNLLAKNTETTTTESLPVASNESNYKNSQDIANAANAEKTLKDMQKQASGKMARKAGMPGINKKPAVRGVKTLQQQMVVAKQEQQPALLAVENIQQQKATQSGITKTALAKNTVVKNSVTKGKIFLQLGSFNQKGNAEDLAKKVGQFSKQQSQIAENSTQIGAKYRVRIGPFKSREEALSLSQKLTQQEFPKSIVVAE